MAKTFTTTKIMKIKIFILSTVLILSALTTGCGMFDTISSNIYGLVGLSDTATVIAKRANIRSSYAVVAADLLEVQRGDVLEILDDIESQDKVHWFRVRAKDDDATEGWIESQNVITGETLAKSKKLAEDDKDLQPQAKAELKAVSNLRLSPDQSPANVLYKLQSGASFDVIAWKYVPKAETATDDSKDPKNNKPKTKNEEIEAAKEANQPEELDDKYDIWYKVRLSPDVSPAPTGWLFGRQVELSVPSDIAFFQIGATKFVTFQRLDDIVEDDKAINKDGAKIFKPGNWVILSRSNQIRSTDGNEPEFDGIMVLGYDKFRQEYYPVYKRGEVYKRGVVFGNIPLKVEGTGDNKTFIVKIKDASGQSVEKRFQVFKKEGRLEVTPPTDLLEKVDDDKKK
jgi:hypothetical protein